MRGVISHLFTYKKLGICVEQFGVNSQRILELIFQDRRPSVVDCWEINISSRVVEKQRQIILE